MRFKKIVLCVCLFYVIYVIGIPVNPAKAASQDLLITELMYNPVGADEGHEWIEIYNAGPDVTNIIGGSGTGSLRFFDGGSNRLLAATAYVGNMAIGPGSYFILVQKGETFLADHPGFSGTVIEVSAMTLSNSGEELGLRIGSSGEIWSSLVYSSSWGANGNDKTLEKKKINGDNSAYDWVESGQVGGTPGKEPSLNRPPRAVLTASAQTIRGEEIECDASDSVDEDGTIISYSFDFGDKNSVQTAESFSTHTYNTSGIFTVTLVVTDEKGAQGTAQQTVSVTEKPVYSVSVVLSEFLASPGKLKDWDGDGTANAQDEWIELANNGDASVDLGGYILDDSENGESYPYVIPPETILASGDFLVFYKKDTKITMNNDKDSIRWLDPEGQLIEQFNYTLTHTDASWAKNGDGNWVEDQTPSPKTENICETEQEDNVNAQDNVDQTVFQPVSIAELRNKTIGFSAEISGTITAAPELLGEQVLYLQDASAGIKVQLDDKDYIFLKEGDTVKISGTLAKSYNELYLKMGSQSGLESSGKTDIIAPRQVKSGEVGESLEGMLIQVNGVVAETSGDVFYPDDGTGKVKIFIKESTGIDKPRMQKEDLIRVTGIVSQYQDTYRILPRYQNDINSGEVLGAVSVLPKTGRNVVAPIGYGFLLLWCAYRIKRIGAGE